MSDATSAPTSQCGLTPVLVSICIANYNYERYVEAAVDSALAQTHRHVEVVVVDDGSTDGSRALLRAYGDRIRLLEQENAGQFSAINAAFAASSGAVVLFLDADDTLLPTALERVVPFVTAGVAKVQFRMQVVNAEGAPLGLFPHRLLTLDEGDVRPLLCREGDYVGPVCSGNAYARTALMTALPLHGGRIGADGLLNSMVPFAGEVRSIDEVLATYRSHGSNHSAASGAVDLDLLVWRVEHELHREREIRRLAQAQGLHVRPDVMTANPEHVLARLLCLRLRAVSPVPTDTRTYLVRRLLTRSTTSHGTPFARRMFVVVVCVLAAALPAGSLPGLAAWTLSSRPRPRLLQALSDLVSPRRKG